MNDLSTMVSMNDPSTEKIWSLLEEVSDPEVPVLSILDLGIVRHV
jgi:ring-1,2-phenylacetyl-CoA epoxidase subunit PaaD